jgi:hypothetical protein
VKKFILLLTLIVSGCATKPVAVLPSATDVMKTSPVSNQTLDKPKATVDIDKELLKPCENFSALPTKNPTPNQILDQHASDIVVHNACARRHSALIKIVKDAFNIRE